MAPASRSGLHFAFDRVPSVGAKVTPATNPFWVDTSNISCSARRWRLSAANLDGFEKWNGKGGQLR
jgi:hypothetical protein